MALEHVRSLALAMDREAASFDAFVDGQQAFAAALHGRQWPDLQKATARLEALAAEIQAAEKERARAETFLRLEMGILDEGLRRLVLRIPEPEQGELLDLHRRLKISAMRTRLENAALGDYAAANRELLSSVIEELFPEKKGRIYGRSGRALQPGSDALVLDAAL